MYSQFWQSTQLLYRCLILEVSVLRQSSFFYLHLNSTISLGGHDIEENWQIDSQKLRVFDDEVLGEGEFGIVKKGHYGGRNVAVKQLKGGKR